MLIFAYGTLREPLVRDRILGHPVEAREAVLRGHAKVCGWDYLTVVPDPGRDVRGVVFEASDRDVEAMDEWEDVPVYELVPVQVECGTDTVEAFSYIMPEPPAHYEVADDSAIAAIPIDRIVMELDSIFGSRK